MSGGTKRYRTLCAVLAAAWGLNGRIATMAADGLQPSFRLDLTQQYPQLTQNAFNSPIFYSPAPGTIVLIQGQCVYGGKPTAVVSTDAGRSWSNWDAFSTWPNRPYADVVRRGPQLLAFTLEAKYVQGTDVWVSQDHGVAWTGGSRMVEGAGQWVPMNQRVLVTLSGRVILPIDVVLGNEGPAQIMSEHSTATTAKTTARRGASRWSSTPTHRPSILPSTSPTRRCSSPT